MKNKRNIRDKGRGLDGCECCQHSTIIFGVGDAPWDAEYKCIHDMENEMTIKEGKTCDFFEVSDTFV